MYNIYTQTSSKIRYIAKLKTGILYAIIHIIFDTKIIDNKNKEIIVLHLLIN